MSCSNHLTSYLNNQICSNDVYLCMQVSPGTQLSSLTTESVCERMKHIDGIDPNMLPHYNATIKKVRLGFTFPLYLSIYL